MIPRIFLIIGFVLALIGGAQAAETVMTEPKPTMDNPRKVILQLTSRTPRTMNNLLFNVVNIQKFYGQDNVKIAVVAFSDGMRALYRKSSPVKERIESLLLYDVEFVACGNTMTATKRKAGDLIPGVKIVTAGIPEIIERTRRGWIYIRP